MNFVMAVFLLTIGFSFGMKPFIITEADLMEHYEAGNIVGEFQVVIQEVLEGSPANNSGLQANDIVLSIEGKQIQSSDDILNLQLNKDVVNYEIMREEEILNLDVSPDENGKIGIALNPFLKIEEIKKIQYPFYIAPWEALKTSAELGKLTVVMFGKLLVNLTQFVMPKDVAGPVGIVQMTHRIVELGEFMELIKFTALLSISLAVINILPIPALDGGRLVFLGYEAITRRKPSPEVETMIHGIGYIFLMGLILVITWNDFNRIFHFSDLFNKLISVFS